MPPASELTIYQTKPNIGQNLWLMGHNFPQTNLVDIIFYGVWKVQVMDYESLRYGLRLYFA